MMATLLAAVEVSGVRVAVKGNVLPGCVPAAVPRCSGGGGAHWGVQREGPGLPWTSGRDRRRAGQGRFGERYGHLRPGSLLTARGAPPWGCEGVPEPAPHSKSGTHWP